MDFGGFAGLDAAFGAVDSGIDAGGGGAATGAAAMEAVAMVAAADATSALGLVTRSEVLPGRTS